MKSTKYAASQSITRFEDIFTLKNQDLRRPLDSSHVMDFYNFTISPSLLQAY